VMPITKWSIAFIACCGKGGIIFRPVRAGRFPSPSRLRACPLPATN